MVILVVLELIGYFGLLRGFRGFFIQTKHNIKKKKQFYLTQKIQQNMIFSFFQFERKLMIVISKKKKKTYDSCSGIRPRSSLSMYILGLRPNLGM